MNLVASCAEGKGRRAHQQRKQKGGTNEVSSESCCWFHNWMVSKMVVFDYDTFEFCFDELKSFIL
jgi:hypothetical protein